MYFIPTNQNVAQTETAFVCSHYFIFVHQITFIMSLEYQGSHQATFMIFDTLHNQFTTLFCVADPSTNLLKSI